MTLQLLLFTASPQLAQQAVAGGAAAIVIDWERAGKAERQSGADTVVSGDTQDDLRRIRAATAEPVICRIDSVGDGTPAQIELAVGLGADELLVPMVRGPQEVEQVLDLAGGRCGVGIMLETVEAVADPKPLVSLPLTRVYVGLHDLAIARRSPSLFTAIADGTVQRLRGICVDVPFGFGGMTVPQGGDPIPAALLLGELMRVGADFTVMRRSFWRDVAGCDAVGAVRSIHAAAVAAAARDQASIGRDRAALLAAIENLPVPATPNPGS